MSIPIIHYPFTDADNLGTDFSGNGYDLVVTNDNMELDTDAVRGPVADFLGVIEATGTVPSSITGSNPRTFMSWIKIGSSYSTFFEYGSTENRVRIYKSNRYSTTDLFRWFVYFITPDGNESKELLLDANICEHLAWTYDGTSAKVYLNGVLEFSATISLDTGSEMFEFSGNNGRPVRTQTSDLRFYDTALSASEILSASQNPVVYPPPLSITPWSTFVETSWRPVSNAQSYRLTIDSGNGESIRANNTTIQSKDVYNLQPDTEYTFRLYHFNGTSYELDETETITTLPDTETNVNLEAFRNDQDVYDLSIIDEQSLTRLKKHFKTSLPTGSKVKINNARLNNKVLTFSNTGSTSTVVRDGGIVFPFNQEDGDSQNASLELSDNSSVSVNYDQSANVIDVGGTVYSHDDVFILDGKKVTVYDV